MNDIANAVRILRRGGLVAFPTETVYGLGANAADPAAVLRIFAAKGRPSTNPLIVHVANEKSAMRYAARWPETAVQLARKFWPGPLTIVVPGSDSIAPQVSAGRQTVGLRAPDHPLAMQLLRAFDGPVAAPSANRSTRVSPTTAEHVRQELGNAVDLILDGGPCRVGIESTVLDLSGATPIILRPGFVTREQIESEIGRVEVFQGLVSPSIAAASPGQHAIHYAPQLPAYRFESGELSGVSARLGAAGLGGMILLSIGAGSDAIRQLPGIRVIEMPLSAEEYARALYAALRTADDRANAAILVEMPPDDPAWAAVRDRLMRATKPVESQSES
jgi:L-threonylcarbamoyladenylate synthase